MTFRSVITAATLAAALGMSVPAYAQDSAQLNEQGIEAFQDGRFAEAADFFRDAARTDPDPLLRKNEAIARFKAGQYEAALDTANAFLHVWPEQDENRLEAQAIVANCKIEMARVAIEAEDFKLAERLLGEAEESAPDGYTRDRVTKARVELAAARQKHEEAQAKAQREEEKQQVTPPENATPAVTEPAASSESSGSSAGGWIMASGIAVAAAAAGFHAYTLMYTLPEYQHEARGGDAERHHKLGQQLDMARWLVPALYALGGTTTGVGVWMIVGSERESTKTETSVGVSLRGHF